MSAGSQRRRRASSAAKNSFSPSYSHESHLSRDNPGASSGLPANGFARPLPAIPGTPATYMSLSRSPSPRRGGGWASPGLTTPYDGVSGRSTPRPGYTEFPFNGGSINNVTWASAKAKSEEINGYPSFSTQNNGFFSRHARQISRRLPSFNLGGRKDYAEKEKLGRGRWPVGRGGRIAPFLGRILWRWRLRIMLVFGFIMAIVLFYVTRKSCDCIAGKIY